MSPASIPGCRRCLLAPLALAALLLAGCQEVESVLQRTPGTPHEAYAESLRRAGLEGSVLGAEWLAAAERALVQPAAVELPHREEVILPPGEAGAVAFSFPLRLGERLQVSLDARENWRGAAYVDLFELPEDTAAAARHRASADSMASGIRWIARRTGTYVLRVQPELLGGGRIGLLIRTEPSLAFPVSGRSTGAVGSPFGAPRDGGRRDHHGIDIFAPRGTPVVAVAEGTVRSVDTTRIGGRVIWLLDREQGISLYYAHLDSQTVQRGVRVEVGDTLGTVGNTGNARGTPPHLHFGIYRRGQGPVDPMPFVQSARSPPPPVRVETSALGGWRRAAADTRLRSGPPVPRHTPLLTLGASAGSYRVRLPDGREGYLAAGETEAATRPVQTVRLPQGELVLQRPRQDAPAVGRVAAGAELETFGESAGFALVRTAEGREGWVRLPG